MQFSWWKILTILLLFYVVVGGMLMPIPHVDINDETSRNLYYHVPMWFGMTLILTASMVYAIRYLKNPTELNDIYSVESANVGILFGILGIVTGMIWAQYTWGFYWHGDPKQNASAIFLLIYLAYMVLRGAFQDNQQKAKISAVYNIFAYSTMIPLLFILPRLTASLHPGNGGNPGFNIYDSDGKMKLVFYPAVVGWTLLGWWIVTLRVRMRILQNKWLEKSIEKEVEVSSFFTKPLKKMIMKKIALFFVVLNFIAYPIFAQKNNNLENLMRSNGKIYVVVAVLAIILVGILAYLWMMEKKLSKLEKEIQNQQ